MPTHAMAKYVVAALEPIEPLTENLRYVVSGPLMRLVCQVNANENHSHNLHLKPFAALEYGRSAEAPMKATIWHNPQCSKSRAALQTLRARDDIELDVIEYLKQPPDRAKLQQLYSDAGIAPREGVRTYGTDAQERGLTEADDDIVLDAMVADARLIERPLVETEKGVRLCRPPERIGEIL